MHFLFKFSSSSSLFNFHSNKFKCEKEIWLNRSIINIYNALILNDIVWLGTKTDSDDQTCFSTIFRSFMLILSSYMNIPFYILFDMEWIILKSIEMLKIRRICLPNSLFQCERNHSTSVH